jgi:hypothetical protein
MPTMPIGPFTLWHPADLIKSEESTSEVLTPMVKFDLLLRIGRRWWWWKDLHLCGEYDIPHIHIHEFVTGKEYRKHQDNIQTHSWLASLKISTLSLACRSTIFNIKTENVVINILFAYRADNCWNFSKKCLLIYLLISFWNKQITWTILKILYADY